MWGSADPRFGTLCGPSPGMRWNGFLWVRSGVDPDASSRGKRGDAQAIRALHDRICVYKAANYFLSAVRVAQVTTDKWGVRFTFDVVRAPGFDRRNRKAKFVF